MCKYQRHNFKYLVIVQSNLFKMKKKSVDENPKVEVNETQIRVQKTQIPW